MIIQPFTAAGYIEAISFFLIDGCYVICTFQRGLIFSNKVVFAWYYKIVCAHFQNKFYSSKGFAAAFSSSHGWCNKDLTRIRADAITLGNKHTGVLITTGQGTCRRFYATKYTKAKVNKYTKTETLRKYG